MKRVLKKMYCKNCDKEFLVEKDISFCPDCCSILVDMGELVLVEPPKKKSKKIDNSFISKPKKKKKEKEDLSPLDFGEYVGSVVKFCTIATIIGMAIYGMVSCLVSEDVSHGWTVIIAPFEGGLAGVCGGAILALILYPILYPLVRYIKGKKKK